MPPRPRETCSFTSAPTGSISASSLHSAWWNAGPSAVQVVEEVHGFKSFDERDLLGFVDGTENPIGQRRRGNRPIGEDDSDFAGGSYVIVQRTFMICAPGTRCQWEQEMIVGRTKLSDIELPTR